MEKYCSTTIVIAVIVSGINDIQHNFDFIIYITFLRALYGFFHIFIQTYIIYFKAKKVLCQEI